MKKVVGINFNGDERLYYASSENVPDICDSNCVVVSTEAGIKYAYVVSIIECLDDMPVFGNIIRIADETDRQAHNKNIIDQRRAFDKCKKLVTKYNLNMKPIKTEFSFDRSQLLINFFSEERVDFRELAKQMASIFKTRIEFRQIGVRDKARIIGGIGPCGRRLCCSSFLYDFDSISISMAKNQMLALNPNKINGVCGRLLCCLKYEDDIYKEYRKTMPSVGKKIEVDGKQAKVIQVDLYNQKYTVEFEDKNQKIIVVK